MKIDDLKEVFELATTASSFINELMKIKSNTRCKVSDKREAKIKTSGYYAQVASSGYSAQVASSGDSAQVASSGYYAKVASSGDSAQVASSGYYAQVASSGDSAVVAAIGIYNIARAKKGSWLTLAEYKPDENNRLVADYVKTEQVDDERIKEDTYYTLYNRHFHEVEIIDDTKTIILSRKHNVCKARILGDDKNCYIFSKDGINAHGATVKQAYFDWLFKTSDRDTSKYEGLQPNDKNTLDFWVVAYRTITGACSFGTNNYLENNKDKYKHEMSLQEVFEATEGQYGHNTFVEFFNRA